MSWTLLAGAWLATYLIHSTLLIAAAWFFTALAGRRLGEVRDLAWKAALVGGILTSAGQMLLPQASWRLDVALASEPMLVERDAFHSEPRRTQFTFTASEAAVPQRAVHGETSGALAAEPLLPALRARQWASSISLMAMLGCFIGLAFGVARALVHAVRLRQMRRDCQPLDNAWIQATVARLSRRLDLRVRVEVLLSPQACSPLAAGILRPQIILPPAELLKRLDRAQLEGLLAHELAHVARRDPLWALVGHLVCHALWLQPLNFFTRRQLRVQSEYLADALASRAAEDGLGLARCLTTIAGWMANSAVRPTAEIGVVGLFAFRSLLGRRVEALLAAPATPISPLRTWATRTLALAAVIAAAAFAPRVSSQTRTIPSPGEPPMNRPLAALALTTVLAAPTAAEEPKKSDQPAAESTTESAGKVPEAFYGFSGTLAGVVTEKDVEGASLVLKVQDVRNVWKNSKAEQPRSIVGQTVPVEKFFGKWLDVLLVVKPGDTIELETKHVRGDRLQFLGENFKKVAPVSQQARESDGDRPDAPAKEAAQDDGKFPAGLRGFRGILAGKVVSTDVEKGVLVFQASEVKRTWPKNTAKNPGSCQGKELTVNGIAGKWLDVLLVLKPGDAIEVEAFHNRGEALDFVQEWLKKVE